MEVLYTHISLYLQLLQNCVLVLLDSFSGEVRGREMAQALQSEIPHVGLLVREIATEEVASTHLKAWVSVAKENQKEKKQRKIVAHDGGK